MSDWDELERILTKEEPWEGALRWALASTGTVSGTLHLLAEDGDLALAAQVGVPPQVLPAIQRVPIGKGIAGQAAERRAPVSLCNLQTDDSGVAQPGARATGLSGSVAVPLFDAEDRVRGVLGVGHPTPHEFSAEEVELLLEAGRRIAAR